MESSAPSADRATEDDDLGLTLDTAGGVATITIEHARSRNALTDADVEQLPLLLERVGADASVDALAITGSGDAFCSGAHLSKMGALVSAEPGEVGNQLQVWQSAVTAIEQLDKPVVAAINGVCVAAGVALALACDLRLASPAARFRFPSVGVGLVTDLGCTWRLPRLVGMGWAKHLLLTGAWIDAERALAIGLVTRLLDGSDFDAQATQWVRSALLTSSVSAQGVMKRLLHDNCEVDLVAGLNRELDDQVLRYSAAEPAEAFLSLTRGRSPGC